jgi:hypothetical protein
MKVKHITDEELIDLNVSVNECLQALKANKEKLTKIGEKVAAAGVSDKVPIENVKYELMDIVGRMCEMIPDTLARLDLALDIVMKPITSEAALINAIFGNVDRGVIVRYRFTAETAINDYDQLTALLARYSNVDRIQFTRVYKETIFDKLRNWFN